MSERYAKLLDVFAVTTGADSLEWELEPAEAGGAGDEAALDGEPESIWVTAITTATAATTLPMIVHTSGRPRRMSPPTPLRLRPAT
jgi:hypothetical protein